MTGRVSSAAAEEEHPGAARLTGDQVIAINRFPDDNPNPVMRIDADGHLIYANPASAAVQNALGIRVGERLPEDVIARLEEVAVTRGYLEFVWENRTFAVWPVPIPDLNFTNLYGTDVTAERAIVKFPDQNPNPVFRVTWDGMLVYANPASAGLVAGLGLTVGMGLGADLRESLLARIGAGDRSTVDVEAAGRSYALLPVDVPEFGFVNVYGTDVTAVKERERLARENERLLLNILPEPIAHRLRNGEALIADRFEDVTLLFADIVEFTRLSATLSADALVGALNDISSSTVSRRSRRSGTPTWSSAAFPSAQPTTRSAWPQWPSSWLTPSAGSTRRRGSGSPSGSGSIAVQWSPASSARRSSSTTSGVTPSTWQAGWNRSVSRVASRCRQRSWNGSATLTTSSRAGSST